MSSHNVFLKRNYIAWYAFCTVVVVLSSTVAYARPHARVELKIDGLGSFTIPDVMEVQGARYKKNADVFYLNEFGVQFDKNRVVIQQKGINDGDSEAKKLFVRFIINTSIGKIGEYSNLDQRIPLFRPGLIQFDRQKKEEVVSLYKKYGLNILSWNAARKTMLNAYPAITLSYERSIMKNQPVSVETYYIMNNDRLHSIQLQYRTSEKNRWYPLLIKMLSSLSLVKH